MMKPGFFLAYLVLVSAACAPKVVVKHWPDSGRTKRVAIMPFKDAPGAPGSGLRAQTAFATNMLGIPAYEIVERGALDDVLKEHQLGSSGLVDETHAVEIGKLLNADSVVIGELTELDERWALIFPPASVALSVRLIDAKTGVVEWTASHRVGGLKRLFTWIVWPVGVVATITSPTADSQIQSMAEDICKAVPKTALASLRRTGASSAIK